jgi:arsenate reductase
MTQRRVLVVCTHNSARSQMAEGMLRTWGGERIAAFSAGTELSRVRPEAIEVMGEIGIDISGQRSKLISEFAGQAFDWVVTVCDRAQQQCATIPGMGPAIHWSVEDPSEAAGDAEERLLAFRRARDDLQGRIRNFIHGVGRDDAPPPEPVELPDRITIG